LQTGNLLEDISEFPKLIAQKIVEDTISFLANKGDDATPAQSTMKASNLKNSKYGCSPVKEGGGWVSGVMGLVACGQDQDQETAKEGEQTSQLKVANEQKREVASEMDVF